MKELKIERMALYGNDAERFEKIKEIMEGQLDNVEITNEHVACRLIEAGMDTYKLA